MIVAVQDGEEIPIPEKDWEMLRDSLREGEKPLVELSTGTWINFQFVKRIYNRFEDLPEFKGGDPSAEFMEKKRSGKIS